MRKIGEPRLPLLLSVADAAGELGCSVRTIKHLIAEGQLQTARLGGRMVRVQRASLLRLAADWLATRGAGVSEVDPKMAIAVLKETKRALSERLGGLDEPAFFVSGSGGSGP
jgi:excisionase family DNA binding protein